MSDSSSDPTIPNTDDVVPSSAPSEEKEERSIIKVLAQLDPQYGLGWQEQRDLIRSESPLTERGVAIAVQVARSFRLPLQGINVIASRTGVNVYVNSDGVRWRLHTDPRGITYSNAEITHRPTKEEPWVEVQATIVMGHGEYASTYVNYGVTECQPGPGVANAILKAVTKSKRRAGVDAVGVALPIFEDYLEYDEERNGAGNRTTLRPSSADIVDAQYTRVSDPNAPHSFPELLTLAISLGFTFDTMMDALGTRDVAVVSNDLAAAAAKLKAAKATPA